MAQANTMINNKKINDAGDLCWWLSCAGLDGRPPVMRHARTKIAVHMANHSNNLNIRSFGEMVNSGVL